MPGCWKRCGKDAWIYPAFDSRNSPSPVSTSLCVSAPECTLQTSWLCIFFSTLSSPWLPFDCMYSDLTYIFNTTPFPSWSHFFQPFIFQREKFVCLIMCMCICMCVFIGVQSWMWYETRENQRIIIDFDFQTYRKIEKQCNKHRFIWSGFMLTLNHI